MSFQLLVTGNVFHSSVLSYYNVSVLELALSLYSRDKVELRQAQSKLRMIILQAHSYCCILSKNCCITVSICFVLLVPLESRYKDSGAIK